MWTKSEWERECFPGDERADPQQAESSAKIPVLSSGKCGRLLLYGAGYGGQIFLELLRGCGVEPEGFLDASPQKRGRAVMGLPVYAPEKEWVEGAAVVVCLLRMDEGYEEIKRRLASLGCRLVCHMYELREDRRLFQNQPLIFSPDRELLWTNREQLYRVYQLLEDDASRDTLTAVLRFLWGRLHEPIPALPMEEQYFADIYHPGAEEVFVDCGAHVGEIFCQFLQRTEGNFGAYWAFEPDLRNVHALEKAIPDECRSRVHIKCLALGEKPETVRVRNYDGNNSLVRPDGDQTAACVPLDSFWPELRPTHLKVDVEGWENSLLRGARTMICKEKPLISIAVYHNEADFWTIPLCLKQWVPEYRFYLRSYLNVAETVLYAVPPAYMR